MSNSTSRMTRRSPLQAIRVFCLECDGGSSNNVNSCLNPACPFYGYRLGTLPDGQPHQSVKAIRTYCFEQCQAGSDRSEVLTCQGDKAILGPCPIYPFRLGKNPHKSKPLSDERRTKLVKAGKEYRFKTGQPPPFSPLESPKTDFGIVRLGSFEINNKTSVHSTF